MTAKYSLAGRVRARRPEDALVTWPKASRVGQDGRMAKHLRGDGIVPPSSSPRPGVRGVGA